MMKYIYQMQAYKTADLIWPTSMLVTCSPEPGLSPPPHSMPAGMAEVESSLMSDTSRTFTTPFVWLVCKERTLFVLNQELTQ